ncbi:unnamed protein product [Spirodela intermedia]|uniref:Uncharacterized protein n=1 Tax=Spirodela intermedia TaxID=51605 RepID=A0A7I8JN86_SPIIN|nr:unnamed protein product [Spirodela intermedia]CAA6671261.1 unnamed protein product [Spirodela intermedia]
MSEALSNLKNSRRRGYRRLGQQLSFNSLNEDDERGGKETRGTGPRRTSPRKGEVRPPTPC